MAASRRGQPPLSVHLPKGSSQPLLPDFPPISALFLIDFDVKAGYTIVWKRAVPGLELEGVVEYKSLPSGLHTVTDDLIYFVHDGGYAGLSAFINTRTEDEGARNARMIAVGILVPLSYGRLGRAWRHAEALKELATQLAADRKQDGLLDVYWKQHGARDTTSLQPLAESPLTSPTVSRPRQGHTRNRSASDGAALLPSGRRLSPFHPAWSLTKLLETFGPLIFPIHRAALLRKRILISTHAPVHEVCNFVYDISILSNIPQSAADILDPDAPLQRLRPLFTVGVHDIPSLVEYQASKDSADPAAAVVEDSGSGWIACTTDSILAVKGELWDMLITMPPPHAANLKEKAWPTVESPKGVPVRATQRDLRRFRHLQSSLARLTRRPSTPPCRTQSTAAAAVPSTPGAAQSAGSSANASPQPSTSDIRLSAQQPRPSAAAQHTTTTAGSLADYESDKLVEPASWAALAYSGFMWWASAGEQRRGEEEDELGQDAALLAADATDEDSAGPKSALLPPLAASVASLLGTPGPGQGDGGGGAETDDDGRGRAPVELAVIAYFHRLTARVLAVLAEAVEAADEDDVLGVDVAAVAAGGVRGGSSSSGYHDADGDARARLLRPGVHSGDSEHGEEEDDDDEWLGAWVRVDSRALADMGLDVWSRADADFVRDLTARYFARRAYVEGKGVEVCGLRVC